MNTYLLPICYPEELPKIITVISKEFEQAEDKFMDIICNHLDVDNNFISWSDFVSEMCEQDCLVGEIYDIDQF